MPGARVLASARDTEAKVDAVVQHRKLARLVVVQLR